MQVSGQTVHLQLRRSRPRPDSRNERVHSKDMEALPEARHPKNSNAVARARDAKVLWLLQRHPATAGMLADIGLFPTRKKASKRLGRLRRRSLVRRLGTVSLRDGRPEHVYGRGHWKADNLLHETQLTRVCLKIDAEEVRRGAAEVDSFLHPDAELLIRGERYYLELDRGTMSYPEIIRGRFDKYRASRHLVLWVCPSHGRLEGLRKQAGLIREVALFTTLELALANPHAAIWLDFDGERAALPRSTGGGDNAEYSPGDQGGAHLGPLSPPASGGHD